MAKPDTDDGYFRLAYEVLASILTADFTRAERYILFEVFAQIYGKSKLARAMLSPRNIARRSGLDVGSISHAIRDLVTAGVLAVEDGLDGYAFVKDYEAWDFDAKAKAAHRRNKRSGPTKSEEPKAKGRRIAYVAHAPLLAKFFDTEKLRDLETNVLDSHANLPVGPEESSDTDDQNVGERAYETLAHEPTQNGQSVGERAYTGDRDCRRTSLRNVGERAYETLAHEPTNGESPLEPPIRMEKSEKSTEQTTHPAGEPVEARIPGYDNLSPADRIELDAVAFDAADWFPTNDVIAKAIVGREGGFSVAAYRAAAERLRVAEPRKRTRAYFLTIVSDYDRNGIPDDLRPAPRDQSPTIPAARPETASPPSPGRPGKSYELPSVVQQREMRQSLRNPEFDKILAERDKKHGQDS